MNLALHANTECYQAIYNQKYDFMGQSYATLYPNLHKYPATMLPQIGFELLCEFHASKTNILDPFCGSGSSFTSAIKYGIKECVGFDLNPLAIIINNVKFSFIERNDLLRQKDILFENIKIKTDIKTNANPLNNITNCDFWIEKQAQLDLSSIFYHISNIKDEKIKNIFTLAFSETLREASYTRNNEFKLFRMKNYQTYFPNTFEIFKEKTAKLINDYLTYYQPQARYISHIVYNSCFKDIDKKFDTILTSPPYGDSKTTVAYGQFSTFINEWLGFKDARQLDSKLMGGKKSETLYNQGVMKDFILEISKIDSKRALEVSSYYYDLESSIKTLANAVNKNGKIFFVVGNRKVKNIALPTDKFIAEAFCKEGFTHITTIKRKISNKVMPKLNSPTNKTGKLSQTINDEYIIVCKKSEF
ncbi:TPA: modification methylase [Campylobacter lari]|nr:modification methylase [Campylobacter lari]